MLGQSRSEEEAVQVIIYDSSALLDLYRYSIPSSKRLLEYMKNYLDNTWLPAQVREEVQRNQDNVRKQSMNKYKNIGRELNNNVDGLKDRVSKWFTNYRRYNFPNIDELEAEIVNKIADIRTSITKYNETLKEEEGIHKEYINEQVDFFLKKILESERVGEKFNVVEILDIIKEGELRYKYDIPPGYKDEENKEGIRKFGDLILWKEILRKAQEAKSLNVTFVLSDTKPDWFQQELDVVRTELLEEFSHHCGDNTINIIPMSRFIQNVSDASESDRDLILELRKEKIKQRFSNLMSRDAIGEYIDLIIGDITEFFSHAKGIDEIYEYEFDFDIEVEDITVRSTETGSIYEWGFIVPMEFSWLSYVDTITSNGTIDAELYCKIKIERGNDESEDEFAIRIMKGERKDVLKKVIHWSVEHYLFTWGGDHDIED